MTVLSTLVVEIVGDITKYQSAIQEAQGITSTFSGQAMSGLSVLGGGIVAGSLAAAGAGITALGFGLKNALDEASAAEGVMSQTNAAIESTGGAAGLSAEQVAALAQGLSEVTPFEDDMVQSGENLLLTFTNIGKDVFPSATETMLDMSQALGQDLKSSAVQLGKALQDPIAGVTALSRVGVNFSDDQKEMIKSMVESGDVMGAQKFILAELQREFGGSARAAGNTFAGQMEILNNQFGNMKETLGNALMPALQKLMDTFSDIASRPEVKQFIADLASGIQAMANTAVEWLPKIGGWFAQAFQWLTDNQGVIVAALAVVTAAIVSWAVSSAIAIAPLLLELLPVAAVILLIGGAAYLLYEAWTNNWGGIQQKTAEVWAWMEPKISAVVEWLQVNIPAAIETAKNYWTSTLLPAIQEVWAWIDKHIMPLLGELGQLIGVTLANDFKALAFVWEAVLQPVLGALWNILSNVLGPVIKTVGGWLVEYFAWGFDNTTKAVHLLIDALQWMGSVLDKLSIPDWLTPGSPTPFENGLRGINDALELVNSTGLPGITSNLALVPAGINESIAAAGPGGAGPRGAGVVFNYVDNATLRSTSNDELIDKLGPALAEFLRREGLI